jgi:hypothetical protein
MCLQLLLQGSLLLIQSLSVLLVAAELTTYAGLWTTGCFAKSACNVSMHTAAVQATTEWHMHTEWHNAG